MPTLSYYLTRPFNTISCTMSQYRYSLLLLRHNSIYLFRLMPDKDKSTTIKCQIFKYSLKLGKETYLYKALSYIQGDINKTMPIFINKHSFNVMENLYKALLCLRNHSIEQIIQVDAVCINQADNQEKKHQIQRMAKIYGQANRVIVWLGETVKSINQRLEEILIATGKTSTNSLNNKTVQQEILVLL